MTSKIDNITTYPEKFNISDMQEELCDQTGLQTILVGATALFGLASLYSAVKGEENSLTFVTGGAISVGLGWGALKVSNTRQQLNTMIGSLRVMQQ